MFEYLEGKLAYKKPDYIALDIQGVAYRIYISLRSYEALVSGEVYRMFIYNHIKEDDYRLIGFLEEKERKLFELLLSVKGIGVSLALAALSSYTVEQLVTFIQEENISALKKIPKLGEKKAQQMILDIKNKLKSFAVESGKVEAAHLESMAWAEDIASALENLGYASKEIGSLLLEEDWTHYTSLEEAMKAILRKLKK